MPDAVQSIFAEWSLPPYLTLSALLTGAIYWRGWLAIRHTRRTQFPVWRLASFLAGLVVLWLAIGSPLDGFADAMLSAHMVEHLLLMSAVPPLVLLGWPVVPMLRGLPRWILRAVAPLLRSRTLRHLGHWLISPIPAWLAMNFAFLAWHVPAAYDFALEHEHWHEFEHLCFLFTSLLFWWCIIRPWPSRRSRPGWGIILFLITADLVNTALSAFLAFCERPVYPFYANVPNPFSLAPLDDQVLGAVIMWVIGSIAFLAPAIIIANRLLQTPRFDK